MSKSEILKELEEIKKLLIEQADKPMTVTEAAEYLHISKSYLYKMTSACKISYFKPAGKKIYFTKSELNKWIKRNRVKSDYELEEMANKYILNSTWKRKYK